MLWANIWKSHIVERDKHMLWKSLNNGSQPGKISSPCILPINTFPQDVTPRWKQWPILFSIVVRSKKSSILQTSLFKLKTRALGLSRGAIIDCIISPNKNKNDVRSTLTSITSISFVIWNDRNGVVFSGANLDKHNTLTQARILSYSISLPAKSLCHLLTYH